MNHVWVTSNLCQMARSLSPLQIQELSRLLYSFLKVYSPYSYQFEQVMFDIIKGFSYLAETPDFDSLNWVSGLLFEQKHFVISIMIE